MRIARTESDEFVLSKADRESGRCAFDEIDRRAINGNTVLRVSANDDLFTTVGLSG